MASFKDDSEEIDLLPDENVYPFGHDALDNPAIYDEATEAGEIEKSKSDDDDSDNELSDISEDYIDRTLTTSRSRGSTFWYSRFKIALMNPQMKKIVITNTALFLIIVFLLIVLLSLCIVAIVFHYQAVAKKQSNVPCVYEWGEWSQCSATCKAKDKKLPTKFRKIDLTSVIRARGKFHDIAPCPKYIKDEIETAPCNTHLCPVKLSTFPYSETCYDKLIDGTHHQVQVRMIGQTDQLIEVDGEVYKKCSKDVI
ncbi:unnamed protein product [Bursaphelenchus okinawaensis]|uniref:Uncharacterized protein n=1 Tax=Bursaphelenchus okinawaensis TaxID=465554 RepID=A0A811LCV8_9BILA|nr:unnamed protein product [Bursaphelenchus okinawaensis]CAG9121584.1 unnamed protein product [Bursaphelenchus okinawaensis]